MTGRVTVVGAVNVDLMVVTDTLPGPGETVVGPRVVRSGGGKGANAAVAAAAAGARTTLVGAVGRDGDGDFARDDLAARGVDVTSVVQVDTETTGSALIVVDSHGENQIAVGMGANAALGAAQVTSAVAANAVDCVLISTEIPGPCVIAAVHAARRIGARCVLNPAPVIAEVVDLIRAGQARNVILTPNESEAVGLARALGLDALTPGAVAEQLSLRTQATVVVTLGAAGTVIAEAGRPHRALAATPVDTVVDTTGAGDCFNGAFAAALAAGSESLDAARAGMQAAGHSVGWVGARQPLRVPARPTRPAN